MKKGYIHNPASLKIDLMLRGVRVKDPVLKAWACGTDGIDLMLPRKTLVNIPCSEAFCKDSPYTLGKLGDECVLSDGASSVKVSLVERPAFLDCSTSSGARISNIARVHGNYTVITPSRRCDFVGQKVECKYCSADLDITGGQGVTFTVDDVLETVEAVTKERSTGVIYLSIGFADGGDGGIEFLAPYVRAIKKHFNCLVAVETLPPAQNRWIDETYALGADSVIYNIEIFDKELFELICPGRARHIGRKRYTEALEYAAKVFPNGTVGSHLIVGLEMPGSTCQGIDYLTSIGVVPILPIYRPAPGRALRIEPLTAEIIIPVYKHLYKALKQRQINLNWFRDLSMVTTPVEGRLLVEGESSPAITESFLKSKIGYKATLGLSAIRRKLRVKTFKEE